MDAAAQKLELVYRPPDSLRAYERNSRKHSAEQVEQIVRAIREFGFTNPILLRDDNTTIGAGHARQTAALILRLPMVPTITLYGLSETQWRAYVIADNQLALNASWDLEILKSELLELQGVEFDLTLTGFASDELADMLFVEDGLEGDPDEAEELSGNPPVTVHGDVWELGGHRIMCGDATSAEAVKKLLGGVRPALMVTDPPYGISYDPAKRSEGLKDGADRAVGRVMNDTRADWREAWMLFPGDIAYVWHAYKTATTVEESLVAAGFVTRAQIVWRKPRATLSPGNMNPKTMGYNAQHECAWYCVREGSKSGWKGDRAQTTVWDIDHVKNDSGHGTQKPVDCMKRPIENNSSPGQAVYDPFCGSGTTILAAEMTGRVAFGLELDPAYVDLIVGRVQRLSGKTAVHLETGLTFAELLAERQPGATLTTKLAAPKPSRSRRPPKEESPS